MHGSWRDLFAAPTAEENLVMNGHRSFSGYPPICSSLCKMVCKRPWVTLSWNDTEHLRRCNIFIKYKAEGAHFFVTKCVPEICVLVVSELKSNLSFYSIRCVITSTNWDSAITVWHCQLAGINGKSAQNKCTGLNWATSAIMTLPLMLWTAQAQAQGCWLKDTCGTAKLGKCELMQGQAWTWREESTLQFHALSRWVQ